MTDEKTPDSDQSPQSDASRVGEESVSPAATDDEDLSDWPLLERMDTGTVAPACRVCGLQDDHVCEVVSPSKLSTQSTTSRSSAEEYAGCQGGADVELCATLQCQTETNESNKESKGRGAEAEAEAATPSKRAGASSSGPLQRKKSDPIGLELNRLKDQAAGWLHGMSPGEVSRFMASRAAGGVGKAPQAAWGFTKSGRQESRSEGSPTLGSTQAAETPEKDEVPEAAGAAKDGAVEWSDKHDTDARTFPGL